GIISTFAGDGSPWSAGDWGKATAAQIKGPSSVAAGPDGSLYIVENDNFIIRKVGPDGIISPVAGRVIQGEIRGYNGDGGPAVLAQLDGVGGLAVGPDGSLYIADSGNHRIRRIGPDGIITTVAGSGPVFPYPGDYAGDGGPATEARLSF